MSLFEQIKPEKTESQKTTTLIVDEIPTEVAYRALLSKLKGYETVTKEDIINTFENEYKNNEAIRLNFAEFVECFNLEYPSLITKNNTFKDGDDEKTSARMH